MVNRNRATRTSDEGEREQLSLGFGSSGQVYITTDIGAYRGRPGHGRHRDVPCQHCGTLVRRSFCRFEYSRRVFCSYDCYWNDRRARNPHYRRDAAGMKRARVLLRRLIHPWRKGYTVHHHDGDNTNNTLSNLAVFASNADHHRYHHGITAVAPVWDGRAADVGQPV